MTLRAGGEMKSKYKLLEVFSIISIVIGIVFFIIPFVWSDVKIDINTEIITIDKLGNMGSYLSGTAGLFLTLASILLVYISLKITFDSLEDQKKEIITQNKLQEIRDFEQLFIFLCSEIESIKDNYLEGEEKYYKELKRIFNRFSYDKNEQIFKDKESGDLEVQVKEENIHLNFDSLILHISNIVDIINSRLSEENINLRNNYVRLLSNKLNKEELRLLELITMTSIFDSTVVENLKALNFRYYEKNEHESNRKKEENRRSYEAMRLIRNRI